MPSCFSGWGLKIIWYHSILWSNYVYFVHCLSVHLSVHLFVMLCFCLRHMRSTEQFLCPWNGIRGHLVFVLSVTLLQNNFNLGHNFWTVRDGHSIFCMYTLLMFGLVSCGLTSHSAIFQLYSDWTVVQFSNLHPTPWAARGLYRAEPTLKQAQGRQKTSLTYQWALVP